MDTEQQGCGYVQNALRSHTEKGDIITLTIGGNDLLADYEFYLKDGLDSFDEEHLKLLTDLRTINPTALIIVGNIYSSQTALSEELVRALDEANAIIAANVGKSWGAFGEYPPSLSRP